jgi:hypothetical protein
MPKIMACRGICNNHRAHPNRLPRYANGQKRCQTCDIFIIWSGYYCPCCGQLMRARPRNSKCKIEGEQELVINQTLRVSN